MELLIKLIPRTKIYQTGNKQIIMTTNVFPRCKVHGVAVSTYSLQCHQYKTRVKIQNVKPNKTTRSTENIGKPLFLAMVEPLGGHPPNPAYYAVASLLYLSP